jgi:streptogramin lyase
MKKLIPGAATSLTAASIILCSGTADAASVRYFNMADRAIATLRVPGEPDWMTIDGDEVWVKVNGGLKKFRRTGEEPVLSVWVTPGSMPCGKPVIAVGDFWTMDCKEAALYRLNRADGAVKAVVPTGISDPDGELSIASGADSIWVPSDEKGVVSRIDSRRNEVVATIKVAPSSHGVVFGFGAVWVTSMQDAGLLQRIDPATNSVSHTIPIGPKPRFLAIGEGSVWTLDKDNKVRRIDPETNKVIATIVVRRGFPENGSDIEVGAGRVWARGTKVALTEIDPRTNEVVARYYDADDRGGAVRVMPDGIWVMSFDTNTLWVLPRK